MILLDPAHLTCGVHTFEVRNIYALAAYSKRAWRVDSRLGSPKGGKACLRGLRRKAAL